ncbi:MAG: shikimate kinase [Bacteroidaceae bacterium]|nr:shikimate kinase [Bacteroidaceae bacterium]MBR4782435.1 shikimate kinase [Bacteroidaceae bacterium]
MQNIILLGYMGAGKSSVGKVLAKKLETDFYDLDWYIERRFRQKVCDIFAERGEEGFRKIERNMMHEVAEFEDIVLALGGGTPCFFDNMDYLNTRGITIFMNASPDTIVSHLKISHTVRPLLQQKQGQELLDHITHQLEERMPFYRKAQHIIDVNCLDSFDKIDTLVDQIIETIKQ